MVTSPRCCFRCCLPVSEPLILYSALAAAEETLHMHSGQFHYLTCQMQTRIPTGKHWPMEDGGSRQKKSLSISLLCPFWGMVFLYSLIVDVVSNRGKVCISSWNKDLWVIHTSSFLFLVCLIFLFATLALPSKASVLKLCLRLYFLGNLG